MGRYVRRGAKGIALVDTSGDALRLRYVFDVSDTGARRNSRPFRPWTVNDGNLSEVRLGLTQDFGAEGEWLSTQLQDAARELAEMYFDEHRYDLGAIIDGSLMAGYDENELRAGFIRAATASAAYALLTRCGYDPAAYYEAEDFSFLNEWNTPEAAAALGGAVSSISQTVLREIERSIRSYERSRYNERNNLYDRERGTASEPEPAREPAPREIREATPEVSAGAPAGAVEQPPTDGQAVRAPERDRGDGTEPHRPDAAEARGGSGRDRDAESQRPDEVDGADERLQRAGRRGSSQRVNLQLNIFDEAEDADAPSAFACPQVVIDAVLRAGENTSYLRERVVAEFEKQRPIDDIAAFLPMVYRGGVGVSVDGERYAAWMDADGMRIARGEAARYARDSQLIPWRDAAERISGLLDAGQYAGSWQLERAAATERQLLAEQLWYLCRDLADEQRGVLLPSLSSARTSTFPEETEHIAAMLADSEKCETLLDEYREFLAAYQSDSGVLRFHYHKTNEILASLESQLLPRVQFHAGAELLPGAPQFITQDEIDELFTSSSRKWRIFRYFTEEHSAADKAAFLKNEYGTGGRSHALSGAAGSHEDHDARGMELSKGGCENIRLTWRQAAHRIDELIETDRFMTAAEIAEYDTHTAAYARHSRAKPYHDGDIVLAEHGGAFYAYGKDAEAAAKALGQQVNRAGGWDYVAIPNEQLDAALDALRAYKPVTLSYENGSELTVDLHLPEDRREKYEQQLYEALLASDYYADAVMNSDAENAALTGERVLREYAAGSDDRDFQRAYYDNPSLRDELNRAALDSAYRDLSKKDEPVIIQPRDPLAPAYSVGDFVWIERRQFEITDIQRGYVELLQSGLDIPIYRSESKEHFEQYLKQDVRNRQITDFLTADLDDGCGQIVSGLLTDDDRTQIARWLRAGKGNTQVGERLRELLDGREGVESDGLHYQIPDDNGNILAAGFLPWEQLAGAVRAMYKRDVVRTSNEVSAVRNAGVENVRIEVVNDTPSSVYNDFKEPTAEGEPELDDTPVTILPRDPMASAYGVGDFVWLDGREYQITDLQRQHVELLPPGLPIPVYRSESRADFERLLRRDERNRYITDYIEQDATTGDAKAAVYIPVGGEWQGFPSVAAAQEAALEEFRRETRRGARNFRITDDHLGEGGAKARFRAKG